MGKSNCDDSHHFDRTSSPTSILPLPPPPSSSSLPNDFDMNWQTALSQSEPSIQSGTNQYINRLATTAYNSSSYKVSIGHETVNITEIARHCNGGTSDHPTSGILLNERRRSSTERKGANMISLCFMCFVSASLILIAISLIHLFMKTNYTNHNDMIPYFFQSNNFTPGYIYVFAKPISLKDTISNLILPIYDRTIRDLATVVCLLIIVLNCFSLLVFSIEIYLGCNMIKTKHDSYRNFNFLFSTSTSRFIAICCFYASIPALILVMCLFILLNMSIIPAIISLIVLGIGLVFILMTLLTYFSTWKNQNLPITNEKLIGGINSAVYQTVGTTNLFNDDEIDLVKVDELSTLV